MQETILIVDDQETVREMARLHLEREGYRVLVAGNGAEALKLSQEHSGPIHLLLTDVMMPGMDGSVLAARLTTARPETKVLYMSAYTPNIAVHHSVVNPGTAFLPKPFTGETLLRTIRLVMDTRRP